MFVKYYHGHTRKAIKDTAFANIILGKILNFNERERNLISYNREF